MRPEGRAKLDSLYFEYPQFHAPARDGLAMAARVVIVGAGPVGMVAALTLAQRGVQVVLLDAKSTFNDGSRAICVARASYNIFQALGVVDAFLEKSLSYVSGRSFFRGQQILQFEMPDGADEKYRPMYNLEQQYIEQFLYDGVAANPLIDMRWQSEVVGVADVQSGVCVSVKDPSGGYEVQAEWVLAADGARSAVRGRRGQRLKGENYEGRYVIADIQMCNPVPVERFALFDPDKRPGSTVLVHQQPDNIWRIDYQLRDGEVEAEALAEASIRQSVSQVLDECGYDAPWELEWWSVYSANTLLLDDYRDGRVFFIGDSAHIVPIFGVRGLNNGLIDAHNIGWKLGAVLNGEAGAALLDSYSPERRGATLDVFENARKSAQFMTPPSRGYSVLRDAALSLALDFPFAGQFANPRNMVPYNYGHSSLSGAQDGGFLAGPVPGAAAPNVDLESGFLLDHIGLGFCVLWFGNGAPEQIAGADLVVFPADGRVAEVYGARDGSAYLMRPDLHVAARWMRADVSAIEACLARIMTEGCA